MAKKRTANPWYETAIYVVWCEMMRTARMEWRRQMSDKLGDRFPVDPVFRDFDKFRLWAGFCWGYRVGETDTWRLARKDSHGEFSPENCYMTPKPPEPTEAAEITAGASRTAYKTGRKPRKMRWGGASCTRLYSIWYHAVQRCTCKGDRRHWQDYGGRGITICDVWRNDFFAFRDWAWAHGYAPDLTLERIDTDGNYCPENCRWAGLVEQHLNTREYSGLYTNLRLTVADMRSVLARIPETAIATLCIRSDDLPDDLPPEADFGPVPEEKRIDAIIKRDRQGQNKC